jgi:hypothetical protein
MTKNIINCFLPKYNVQKMQYTSSFLRKGTFFLLRALKGFPRFLKRIEQDSFLCLSVVFLSDVYEMFMRCLSDVYQMFIRCLSDVIRCSGGGTPSDILDPSVCPFAPVRRVAIRRRGTKHQLCACLVSRSNVTR